MAARDKQAGLVCIPGGTSHHDLLLLGDLRSAVTRMIDRAYAAALDLLRQHRPTLDALAAALFAAGYLDRSEIDAVLAKTPLHKEEKAEATAAQTTRQSTPLLEHDETTIAATEPPSPGPAIIIEA